jgi:hypothetical protein
MTKKGQAAKSLRASRNSLRRLRKESTTKTKMRKKKIKRLRSKHRMMTNYPI